MRKATIFVIAAIYVASIVIVGVFGLNALVYKPKVYIRNIELPEQIGGCDVKPNTDDSGGYHVRLTYSEGLTVPIDCRKVPADADGNIVIDITSQTGSEDKPCAKVVEGVGGWYVEFYKKGRVTLRIQADDGTNVYKELSLTAI